MLHPVIQRLTNFFFFRFREEVSDHKVKWLCKTNFVVKMVANANTGVLEPCMCRVSVRKVGLVALTCLWTLPCVRTVESYT